jgi:hypothetical protein
MRARASFGWLVLPALLCASPTVHAGSAEAEAAFRDGRKAVQAGDWATACARFAESERLEPAPGTLLNLADCEDHQGKLVSAHEHFGVAASGFPRGDTRRSLALAREAQIDRRIVRLTLRLAPSAPPDAVVRQGDATIPASALGSPMLIDPGPVTLVVVAPGRADRPYTLTLHDGDQVEQMLEAGDVAPTSGPALAAGAPAAPPPDVTPAPVPPSGHGQRTLGFVLGGVGVAGLATGAVTGLLALDRASTVKAHCPGLACDPLGLSAASQGQWLASTSTIAFIAGGVLVAAGAYFVFFGGSRSSGIALAPAIGPQSGGAILQGAF